LNKLSPSVPHGQLSVTNQLIKKYFFTEKAGFV